MAAQPVTTSLVAAIQRGDRLLAVVGLERDDDQPKVDLQGTLVNLDVHDPGAFTPAEARRLAAALVEAADRCVSGFGVRDRWRKA